MVTEDSQMMRVWKESAALLKMAAAYQRTSLVALVDRLAQEECARLGIHAPKTQREDRRFKAKDGPHDR